jgi:spermidine dehydrogenase
VGGGVSGLSAAFFYRQQKPDARILVLDNHDDFGGHAKRNEFEIGGRKILGYGGSQSMEAPGAYSDVATALLREIGVHTDRFESAYDQDFYARHGLGTGIYFDKATYGVDKVVRGKLFDPSAFLPVAKSQRSASEAIDTMPLSEAAKAELRMLYSLDEDRLPDHSIFSEPDFLAKTPYRDLLTKHLGVREPEVIALFQDTTSNYMGIGIDGTPALMALGFGLPGLGGTSLGSFESLLRGALGFLIEPYIYHFPDGNASVARMLVRELIPTVTHAKPADVDPMDDVVTAEFDYARLDAPGSPVRLRLESTVVQVEHTGDPKQASEVDVHYVRHGRTQRVRARHCVLACYNAMIPKLCPSLPEKQKDALSELIKSPLVYTNVVLRSWNAVRRTGLGFAHCPGSWHTQMMVDFPVTLGDYAFAKTQKDPIIIHLNRQPLSPGLPPREQFKAGRRELLTTPFEQIEEQIRIHLTGMFGPNGFDPARDIAAITVNRWPHGYAYDHNPIFDGEVAPEERPHARGRVPFGRITIANSDASGRAYLDAAIDEAHRAVGELLG